MQYIIIKVQGANMGHLGPVGTRWARVGPRNLAIKDFVYIPSHTWFYTGVL